MVHQKAVIREVGVARLFLILFLLSPSILLAADQDNSLAAPVAPSQPEDAPPQEDDWRIMAALIGAGASLIGTLANAGLTFFSLHRADRQTKRAERISLALDKFRYTVRNSTQTILNNFCSYENALVVASKSVADSTQKKLTTRKAAIKKVQNESYDANYRHLTAHLRHVGYGHWVDDIDGLWDNFYHALNSLILEAENQALIDQAFQRASKAIADLSQALNIKLSEKEITIAQEVGQ